VSSSIGLFGYNRKTEKKPKPNSSVFEFLANRSVASFCKPKFFTTELTELKRRLKPIAQAD